MKKLTYLLTNLFIIYSTYAQSDGQQLQETFMQEFDPQGYAYYQYNAGIKQQGQQIAQSIASQLDRLSTLNQTNDPQLLINDFNNKMNNIDQLEVALEQQTTNLLNNQASQMGNQLNSGDYMGALANLTGSLEAYSSAKEQQKKLEQQRAELERQKKAQMDEIWRKKYTYTVQVISQLRQQAAFAESKAEEEYYLKSIDYVWCSYYSSYCDQPQKPMGSGIENKFIAKDAVYRQTADRKLQLSYEQKNKQFMIQNQAFYIKDGSDYFVDGAIAFAAKAAQENPSASNYIYLAELQSSRSNILGFTSIMVAESIDPNSISGTNRALYNQLKSGATQDIDQALKDNNTNYLDAFLKGGLDKIIRFNGKSLLVHAISIDNPDAVQLILNHYIEGLNQNEINEKLQKAIMLCAVQDSPNTLKRFKELGVSTDFKMGNHSPVSLASDMGSKKALEVLLKNSTNKSQYESVVLESADNIIIMAKNNPGEAITMMNKLDESTTIDVINKMLDEIKSDGNENLFKVLGESPANKMLLKQNVELANKLNKIFGLEVEKSYKTSKAHLFIRNRVIKLNRIPLFKDFSSSLEKGNKNLLYVAFLNDNYLLYDEIDKSFDISTAANANGTLLYDNILSSDKSPFLLKDGMLSKVNKEVIYSYISSDFTNVSVRDVIEAFYKANISNHGAMPTNKSIKEHLNIDTFDWTDEGGNTLLHLAVIFGIENEVSPYTMSNDVGNKVHSYNIKTKNNDGETAYNIYLGAVRPLRKIWKDQGLENYQLNTMMNKIGQQLKGK